MDPYKVLGVQPGASQDEIKSAYRNLVKKYHPDKYTDEVMKARATEKIKEINEAYDMLTKNPGQGNAYRSSDRSYSGGYSGDFAAEFSRVEICINSGNMAEADAILSSIPLHNARWHYLKGIVDMQTGRYNSATQHFDEAYHMEPGNPEYRNAYNSTHMNSQSYTERYTDGNGQGMDECSGCCQAIMCSWCLSSMCNGCTRGCC